MSVSEKTRRALKEFGLTEYEAKVYVCTRKKCLLARRPEGP